HEAIRQSIRATLRQLLGFAFQTRSACGITCASPSALSSERGVHLAIKARSLLEHQKSNKTQQMPTVGKPPTRQGKMPKRANQEGGAAAAAASSPGRAKRATRAARGRGKASP
ncbi:unnamed protein product, partial [Ectocarpus sp. 12 AP-2014]